MRDRNIFDHTRDCSNIYIIFSFLFGVEMINNGVSTFDVERITNFFSTWKLINYIVYL